MRTCEFCEYFGEKVRKKNAKACSEGAQVEIFSEKDVKNLVTLSMKGFALDQKG